MCLRLSSGIALKECPFLQKSAVGTQRIGAQAKQAAKKVQKAAPKPLVGTKRIGASPPKPKAPSGGGGTGLFGLGPTGEHVSSLFPLL